MSSGIGDNLVAFIGLLIVVICVLLGAVLGFVSATLGVTGAWLMIPVFAPALIAYLLLSRRRRR